MAKKYKILLVISVICAIIAVASLIVFTAGVILLDAVLFVIPMLTACFSGIAMKCLFNYVSRQYPLNNIEDYQYNMKFDEIMIDKGMLTIYACEIEKGICEVKDVEERLLFDLRGFIFPKSYLISYFSRNFRFVQMNKAHLEFQCIYGRLKLTRLKGYSDVKLIFVSHNGKQNKCELVKGKELEKNFLVDAINTAPYGYIFDTASHTTSQKRHIFRYMTEKDFCLDCVRLTHKVKAKPSIKARY